MQIASGTTVTRCSNFVGGGVEDRDESIRHAPQLVQKSQLGFNELPQLRQK
jgi:hypothetical protein